MNKSFMSIYIVFLGIALGVELCAGAFVAPVIFHPSGYLGEGVLTHFQSGILMTQVFLKSNMLLGLVAFYGIVFEVIAWLAKENRDILSLSLSFAGLIFTALFLFYYTPFIVNAQIGLTTESEAFFKMHKESELVMKSLMMVQLVLMFRRVWLIEQKA